MRRIGWLRSLKRFSRRRSYANLFNSLNTVLTPELRLWSDLADRERIFSRSELVCERFHDYLRQWKIRCYPTAGIKEWTGLSVRIWMIFIEPKFLLSGEVAWHLPFR